MTDSTIPDYAAAFQTRHDSCRRLLHLSQAQHILIDEGHFDRLIRLLAEKQTLLESLGNLHSQFISPVDRWRKDRETLPNAVRQHCEKLLNDTEQILADLIQQEQSAAETLTTRRDQTRDDLKAISGGSRIHNSYRQTATTTSGRRLDVRQ
ncbi:MAG: flagellar export chaperone FlgN [Planctomycetaceae bacterium]|nr:flagellar export chaperone FlgN [Planctomycetaceae bacterium]